MENPLWSRLSQKHVQGLLVRQDHVLCTRCYKTEPVHQGNGTPMGSLLIGYAAMALRHQKCGAVNGK